jgi:hypothetical protein
MFSDALYTNLNLLFYKIQISRNFRKIILKLFVLSVGLACNASNFVLRKGNNSNSKCQNYVILKSNRECKNSLFLWMLYLIILISVIFQEAIVLLFYLSYHVNYYLWCSYKLKKTKYHWHQMATAFINIYKCTYVKTANEMKCTN